ncbi:MAG: hypothetical protein AAFO07_29070 [Bacteroidota bacterium]
MVISISWEDVKLILGKKRLKELQDLLKSNSCSGCQRIECATQVIHEIWLNHIGDIIIDGWCKDCGDQLSTYFEASNYPGSYDQAMSIRELKIEVLKDYDVRL